MLAQPCIWVCAGIFLYISASLSACGGKKSDTVTLEVDSFPYTSITRDVSSLISDSGVTKYKLESPVWYTYEQPEAYWYFPEGMYVEQFDTLYAKQASIKADTAYYYQTRKLWKLIGNVEVLNREGGRFFGNSLFWDEQVEEVYSLESTLIIPQPGQEIQSQFGFRSNQSMTRYELYSSHGHLDVDDSPTPTPPVTPTGTTPPPTIPDTLTISNPTNK